MPTLNSGMIVTYDMLVFLALWEQVRPMNLINTESLLVTYEDSELFVFDI